MESPIRILLVDDDVVDRMAVRRALRAAEVAAEVVEVADAPDALVALRQGSFGCVLLDYRLPKADGAAVLREARSAGITTPFIVLTGQGDEQTAVDLMKAGAADYIPKSALSPERLRQSVWHALRIHRAEEEAARAHEHLRRHAAQLKGLTEASLSVTSARSMEEICGVITDCASTVIGAGEADVVILEGRGEADVIGPGVPGEYDRIGEEDEIITSLLRAAGGPVRMSAEEIAAHPVARRLALGEGRGLLAAPLFQRDGILLGFLKLASKDAGDFDEHDEAVLVQLAQVASAALQNVRLYKAEREARERAESASRLKDEFLATVSHELRTPLQSILGWARLLSGSASLDRKQIARGLAIIDRNAHAQAQLVEDMLDVSRIINGKLRLSPRSLPVEAFVSAAADTLRPAAEAKGITITTSIAEDTGSVVGDPDRLQQVVWNLLSNAVKFTPSGGRVDLRAARAGAAVTITVTDTGRGIRREFLPYVFERFSQADGTFTRAYGGLGLGLAIVRHLVELHGGRVQADSEGEGRGSTFTITLPVRAAGPASDEAAGVDAAKGAAEVSAPGAALQGRRILVVDDEADARELLVTVLSQYGADVQAAASAAEGMERLLLFRPDVLISDIAMPGEDGYAFLRRVRRLRPEEADEGVRGVIAVALTAYARGEDRRLALLAGYHMHVAKPVDPRELVAAITKVLA